MSKKRYSHKQANKRYYKIIRRWVLSSCDDYECSVCQISNPKNFTLFLSTVRYRINLKHQIKMRKISCLVDEFV